MPSQRDLARLRTGDEIADMHVQQLWAMLERSGVTLNGGLTPVGYLSSGKIDGLQTFLQNLSSTGVSAEVISTLLNQPDLDDSYVGGYTPLHRACQQAEVGTVQLLLQHKADPNRRKNNGSTPLMVAVSSRAMMMRRGLSPGSIPSASQYLQCANELVQHSTFALEQNDEDGQAKCSPIWATVAHPTADNNPEEHILPMLKMLLANGFNPSPVLQEQSALHMAIWNKYLRCAEALVLAGADVHIRCGVPPDRSPPIRTAIELCEHEHGKAEARKLEVAASARQNKKEGGGRSKLRGAATAKDYQKQGSVLQKQAQKAMDTAMGLLENGQYPAAAAAFTEALLHKGALPANEEAKAHVNRASCYQLVADTERHREAAQEFVGAFPEEPQAHLCVAMAALAVSKGVDADGKAREAVDEAEQLFRQGRGVLLASGYVDRGEMQRRIAETRAGCGISSSCPPEAAQAFLEAMNAEEKGEEGWPAFAEAACDRALAAGHPARSKVLQLKASCAMQAGMGMLDDGQAQAARESFARAETVFREARGEGHGEEAAEEAWVVGMNVGLAAAALGKFAEAEREVVESKREQLFAQRHTRALLEQGRGGLAVRFDSQSIVRMVEAGFKAGHRMGSLLDGREEASWEGSAADAALRTTREAVARLMVEHAKALQSDNDTRARMGPVIAAVLQDARLYDDTLVVPEELQGHYTNLCGFCGTVGACMKCSACKAVYYCSKTCQKDAWKAHKKECKGTSAA